MPENPSINHINERIDRLESRVEDRIDERHADLRERLDDLRRDVAALTGALLARLDAHDEYHRANEHRWGLPRLAARHPFRLASVVAGLALASSVVPNLGSALAQAVSRLAHFLE